MQCLYTVNIIIIGGHALAGHSHHSPEADTTWNDQKHRHGDQEGD